MNYLQRHNYRPGERRTKITLIFAAIAVVFIMGIEWLAPQFFPGLFTSIARPFWITEFSIESGSLSSPSALLAENESLRRQLADDAVRLASYQDLQHQNDDLKALMGRASTTSRILAAVLIRPPHSAYDEFIIDAGEDKGFSSSSIAYAPGNVPIGMISEALQDTSTVVLFSSPGQRSDVLIGPSHISATAIGQGGGQYSAQLPQAAKVSEGDEVIAAGQSASISAASAPMGVVSAIIRDPTQPFETVLFAPPINIYQLRWVLVDSGYTAPQPIPTKPAVSTKPAATSTKKAIR